ncbi:MAG: site-specific integrase [Ignavibacteriae bacterium]|nr:site-specific integrase [Ignavibacteriota bacterium]
MFLSKRANGYYYIYFDNELGKRNKVSTKTKFKKEAYEFLTHFSKEHSSKFINGIEKIDLNTFTNEYYKFSLNIHRPKTTESLKWVFKDFQKFLGNPFLHEITLQSIQDYLNFKRKISIYTVQKHLAYLRSAFNYAHRHKYISKNYFTDIPNFRIPEKQPKFFTKNEYQLLFNSVTELWFRDIIEIAYNTGMRQMEILTLNWNQVDLPNKSITLDNQNYINKSKRVRQVYLSKRACEIINRLYKFKNCDLLFHNNFKEFKQDHISKKFKKHVRRLEINQSLNFHSLRHSFASRLVQNGVSIYHVSKLLGHADIKTTEIYAHLRAEDLKESVEMLN